MNREELQKLVDANYAWTMEKRRALHRIPEEGFREFRIRVLVRLMLRMRVIQIFYHSYSEVSRSVGVIDAVMGLAEGEDAFAGKAGGVVMFPYPGEKVDIFHIHLKFSLFLQALADW